MKERALAVVAAALVVSATPAARADGGPKFSDSLWVPLGLNLGYSLNPEPAPNGFLAGPELSFVYLDRSLYWLGAYTDVLRDFGTDTTRVSAGVESGVAIFGLDLGYVAAYKDDWRHGARARLLVTLPVLHFYAGVGRVGGDGAHTWGEVGALFKFPIPVWEDKTQRYRPQPYPEPEPYRLPPRPPEPEPEPEPAPPPFAEPPPE